MENEQCYSKELVQKAESFLTLCLEFCRKEQKLWWSLQKRNMHAATRRTLNILLRRPLDFPRTCWDDVYYLRLVHERANYEPETLRFCQPSTHTHTEAGNRHAVLSALVKELSDVDQYFFSRDMPHCIVDAFYGLDREEEGTASSLDLTDMRRLIRLCIQAARERYLARNTVSDFWLAEMQVNADDATLARKQLLEENKTKRNTAETNREIAAEPIGRKIIFPTQEAGPVTLFSNGDDGEEDHHIYTHQMASPKALSHAVKEYSSTQGNGCGIEISNKRKTKVKEGDRQDVSNDVVTDSYSSQSKDCSETKMSTAERDDESGRGQVVVVQTSNTAKRARETSNKDKTILMSSKKKRVVMQKVATHTGSVDHPLYPSTVSTLAAIRDADNSNADVIDGRNATPEATNKEDRQHSTPEKDQLLNESRNEARRLFEKEKANVLSQIPKYITGMHGKVGFAPRDGTIQPVLVLNPFDIPPDTVRNEYLDMFSRARDKGRLRKLPHIVYWYGASHVESTMYSFISQEAFVPYEAVEEGIADRFLSRPGQAKVRTEVEQDLAKEPCERRRGIVDFVERHQAQGTLEGVDGFAAKGSEPLEGHDAGAGHNQTHGRPVEQLKARLASLVKSLSIQGSAIGEQNGTSSHKSNELKAKSVQQREVWFNEKDTLQKQHKEHVANIVKKRYQVEEKLKAEIHSLRVTLAGHVRDKAELKAVNASLQESIASLRNTVAIYEVREAERKAENTTLQNAGRNAVSDHNRTRRDEVGLKVENASLRESIASLRKTVADYERKQEEWNTQKKRLEQERKAYWKMLSISSSHT